MLGLWRNEKERLELLNFRAFRRALPSFACRRLAKCQRGDDPPDFLCLDDSARRIGVELVEWISEKQMAASKTRYGLEQSYLRVVRSIDELPPTNVGMVWLSTKPRVRLRLKDGAKFRGELYSFIREKDAAWASKPDWNDPQGFEFTDFTGFPCLGQHLQAIEFYSRERFKPSIGAEWITFPMNGGAYTWEWMKDALIENIQKKIAKYSAPHNKRKLEQQQLDEFQLVAYYDKAVLYNTPYHALSQGFRDIAAAATNELAKNAHPFHKVFLFSPIEKIEKALQIWPRI